MDDALDEIRRSVYRDEKDPNKRKVLKETIRLLLCNGKDIFKQKIKNKPYNTVNINDFRVEFYYSKEGLKEIRIQVNKAAAKKVVDNWLEQVYQTRIPKLTTFANTLKAHKWVISAWYYYHFTAEIEGINNKIKRMKRQAYGYRDQKFSELNILATHEKNYIVVG